LHFEVDANVLIVVPRGDCSSLDAAVLEDELRQILSQISSSKVTGLVIDLEQAPYVGSTMLGGLIKLWRSMTDVKGRLVLCNLSPGEHDVLSATRLDSVWEVYPTRAAAVEVLRSP
jgi:anti-anti-sigma factor